MTWKRITALFVVGLCVAGALYDLVAYRFGGDGATISTLLLGAGDRYPLFVALAVFPAGVFVGHVFLRQHPPPGG